MTDTLQLKQYGSNSIDKRFIVLDEGLINCTLISFYDWRVCLLQHHHECLEVLFTDRELYLFESEKITRLHSEFQIDLDLLRRTAAWESKRRYTRAVFPARESMRRGKKDMVHAFRYLLFAMQIFEHGRIIDFTCANDYYRQIVLGTDEVQDEVQFKALLVQWESERSKLSHQVGEARHSRRFYGRIDTEKRFIYDARNRSQFSEHQLDGVKMSAESLNLTLDAGSDATVPPSSPLDIDNSFNIVYSTLSKDFDSLNGLHDAKVPLVWLRSPLSPSTSILFPQQVQRHPPSPFMKAIANGVVLHQETSPSEDGSHKIRLLSLGLPRVPISKTLSPEARAEWNRRLSLPDASEKYIAEEQLDGTHVTMFLHDGEWKLSSRIEPLNPSMTLSYVPINNVDYEIKLGDAFWKVWNEKGHRLPSIETQGHLCFTFNLIFFEHRHVIRYDDQNTFLVHARDMRDGQVKDHRAIASELAWPLPRLLDPSILPSSLEALESLVFDESPLLSKGYILKPNMAVNHEPWSILAVKNPIYVCICYGTDSMRIGQLNMRVEVDRKMLMDMTLGGTSQRFVDYYPHWQSTFDRVAVVFYELCDLVDEEYHKLWRRPRRELVEGIAKFDFKYCIYNLSKDRYPCLAEYFALCSTKGVFVTKPWRQFLKSKHRDFFDWLHGDDNIPDF